MKRRYSVRCILPGVRRRARYGFAGEPAKLVCQRRYSASPQRKFGARRGDGLRAESDDLSAQPSPHSPYRKALLIKVNSSDRWSLDGELRLHIRFKKRKSARTMMGARVKSVRCILPQRARKNRVCLSLYRGPGP